MNEVEYPSGLRREPAKLLFVGSNPTSTSQSANHLVHGSIAQLAEQRPLKANVAGSTPATPTGYTRLHRLVWSRTLLCRSGDRGSNPLGVVVWEYSSEVEQSSHKGLVAGSSPATPTDKHSLIV
jgi:hypothetical protein